MSEQLDKAAESKKDAEAKSQKIGLVNTSGGYGAGAGGGFGLNKPGFGPPVKHFAGGGGKAVDVDAGVLEAWKKVLDDSQAPVWLVLEYGAGGKSVQVKSTGEGGLTNFLAELPNDTITWGGFRCYGVDKRGGVECKRNKFVFVQWMPEGVSAVKKGKVAPHKGAIKEALEGTHIDIIAETLDDFNTDELIKKLQAATGAHKPNGYEFDEGEFCDADFYGLGIGKDCRGESLTKESA